MTAIYRKLALPTVLIAGCFTAANAHAACATSLSSLNGWYGLLVTGATTDATPVPKYLVGALLFNGAGAVTGSNVYSGAAVDSSASGSYILNTDCTLTMTLTIGSSAPQVYTLAVANGNEAVGIETDASAVAKIDLQAQYATPTSGLTFTNASLNGTIAASCIGPAVNSSDLNLVSFLNQKLKGTDPYNNGGTYVVSSNPYTGTYAINTDGTFKGSVKVDGTSFAFYGVISKQNAKVEYIYANVSNGAATAAFAACVGRKSATISY